MPDHTEKPKTALVLTGGGARAAYQVGVLKAVCELMPEGSGNPFPILCGTSAGAINAASLAVYARQFRHGVRRLNRVWRNFHVDHVFKADPKSILLNGARWLLAMMGGGFGKRKAAYLLDRDPLANLLRRYFNFKDIQLAIESGALYALSITASGYISGQSVSFYQGVDELVPWRRARRIGIRSRIELEHLMASSAIPFLFKAIRIKRDYFGDGSMRQSAPISPALHLGADRVLVIGVHKEESEDSQRVESNEYPSPAQIVGHVLNSIFLDSLDADLERLRRINKTLNTISSSGNAGNIPLREVDVLMVSPSEDLGEIAQRHAHHLPRTLRFFLRGIGAMKKENGSSLISYLLFEQSYCQELISLGYADAMQKKEELMAFLRI
ncbi:MAG: patatin-like phospholipase family protein [Acidiferrobacterales bacterium]